MEGTGKLFPGTALPFWATVVFLTLAYALMCLPNPSSTLFCAVQVASEGACSGYDSMTKRNRHLQPLRRDGYTPKQPMHAVTWCAARKLELQMPGLEAARSSGVRRMLGMVESLHTMLLVLLSTATPPKYRSSCIIKNK
jgi:hypothetical protein